jgi:hypothetical protein
MVLLYTNQIRGMAVYVTTVYGLLGFARCAEENCQKKRRMIMAIKRYIEEFDLIKLRNAEALISEVNDYYYCSTNSKSVCERLSTIENKLKELITDCEEYNKVNVNKYKY